MEFGMYVYVFGWLSYICAVLSHCHFRPCWALATNADLLVPSLLLSFPFYLLAYASYTVLISLLYAWFLVFLLLPELSPHLPLVSLSVLVMCTSFSSATLLLILWYGPFSRPCRLSTSWEGTCICSSGNAVLWVERTSFLAVPEWRSSSATNKQNPFICETSCFLHWKLCFSNTGHYARGTWNHRIHWAHLPDVMWNFGRKIVLNFSSS